MSTMWCISLSRTLAGDGGVSVRTPSYTDDFGVKVRTPEYTADDGLSDRK